jgi:hypothetical protein
MPSRQWGNPEMLERSEGKDLRWDGMKGTKVVYAVA